MLLLGQKERCVALIEEILMSNERLLSLPYWTTYRAIQILVEEKLIDEKKAKLYVDMQKRKSPKQSCR